MTNPVVPPGAPLNSVWLAPKVMGHEQANKWLAPNVLGRQQDDGKASIKVPAKWLGLFKSFLLAPAHHSWANQLLQLDFSKLILTEGEKTAFLALNNKVADYSPCPLLDGEPLNVKGIEESLSAQNLETSPSSKKRTRKAKPDTPIVDSAVRRSSRVRAICNGFKRSACNSKNCLGCSVEPPTLSPTSLKKIGVTLCKIQPALLEEEILLKKKKMKPIGKKQKKGRRTEKNMEEKAINSEEDAEDEGPYSQPEDD